MSFWLLGRCTDRVGPANAAELAKHVVEAVYHDAKKTSTSVGRNQARVLAKFQAVRARLWETTECFRDAITMYIEDCVQTAGPLGLDVLKNLLGPNLLRKIRPEFADKLTTAWRNQAVMLMIYVRLSYSGWGYVREYFGDRQRDILTGKLKTVEVPLALPAPLFCLFLLNLIFIYLFFHQHFPGVHGPHIQNAHTVGAKTIKITNTLGMELDRVANTITDGVDRQSRWPSTTSLLKQARQKKKGRSYRGRYSRLD